MFGFFHAFFVSDELPDFNYLCGSNCCLSELSPILEARYRYYLQLLTTYNT